MFYGVDVNHARLFPLCHDLTVNSDNPVSIMSVHRVDGVPTTLGSDFRRPLSPLLHHALRRHSAAPSIRLIAIRMLDAEGHARARWADHA